MHYGILFSQGLCRIVPVIPILKVELRLKLIFILYTCLLSQPLRLPCRSEDPLSHL